SKDDRWTRNSQRIVLANGLDESPSFATSDEDGKRVEERERKESKGAATLMLRAWRISLKEYWWEQRSKSGGSNDGDGGGDGGGGGGRRGGMVMMVVVVIVVVVVVVVVM
ncbi:hypothetical protein V1477_010730, partial [Vespula maculifrons]